MAAYSEAAFERIKNQGDFDNIKNKILDELRKDENFKAIMTEAVSKSQTIEKANLDRLDKKQLLADLRKEIESDMQAKAIEIIWDMMNNPEGHVGRSIEDSVAAALQNVMQQGGGR